MSTCISIGIGIPFIKPSGGASNTPRVSAFLTATGITDVTIIAKLNAMDLALIDKSFLPAATGSGILKALYPLKGGDSTTCKFNFVNPADSNAAHRLQFFGGITFDSQGMQGNGTNGYANANFNARNELGIDSACLFMYSFTNVNNSGYDMGAFSSSTTPANCQFMMQARSADFMFGAVNQDDPAATPVSTDSTGFHAVSRINGTQEIRNVRGTNTTYSRVSKDEPDLNQFLMALNFNGSSFGYSSRKYGTMGYSEGLTTTQLNDLETIIETFNS